MIARIWHGKTHSEHYEAYTSFLRQTAIPDYEETPGFIGLTFLRRMQNREGHFTLITYWESIEVVKNFAGDNYHQAKYYPEDDSFLIEFEEEVQHHEVFASKN